MRLLTVCVFCAPCNGPCKRIRSTGAPEATIPVQSAHTLVPALNQHREACCATVLISAGSPTNTRQAFGSAVIRRRAVRSNETRCVRVRLIQPLGLKEVGACPFPHGRILRRQRGCREQSRRLCRVDARAIRAAGEPPTPEFQMLPRFSRCCRAMGFALGVPGAQ